MRHSGWLVRHIRHQPPIFIFPGVLPKCIEEKLAVQINSVRERDVYEKLRSVVNNRP